MHSLCPIDRANKVRVAQDEVTLSDILEALIVNEEYMEDNYLVTVEELEDDITNHSDSSDRD